MVLAVISAAVVILTAGYILWTIQRVYLGPEYKGPHGEHLTPMTPREIAIAAPLLALAILFGVYPQAIFNYMEPSVTNQVKQLADWTRTVHDNADGERGTGAALTISRRFPASKATVSRRSDAQLANGDAENRYQEESEEKLHRHGSAAVTNRINVASFLMIPLVAQSSFSQLVSALVRDTMAVSLPAFRTELGAVRHDRADAAGARVPRQRSAAARFTSPWSVRSSDCGSRCRGRSRPG